MFGNPVNVPSFSGLVVVVAPVSANPHPMMVTPDIVPAHPVGAVVGGDTDHLHLRWRRVAGALDHYDVVGVGRSGFIIGASAHESRCRDSDERGGGNDFAWDGHFDFRFDLPSFRQFPGSRTGIEPLTNGSEIHCRENVKFSTTCP